MPHYPWSQLRKTLFQIHITELGLWIFLYSPKNNVQEHSPAKLLSSFRLLSATWRTIITLQQGCLKRRSTADLLNRHIGVAIRKSTGGCALAKLKDLLGDLSMGTARPGEGESLAIHDSMDIAFSNECKVFLISDRVYHPS